MYDRNIEVSPFYSRKDITIKIQNFLDEVDKNVFLRMYVPNSRFQSDQFEGLLRIFERYLRQVESQNFNIESRTTSSGTTYIFCGTDSKGTFRNLEETFERFDHFMKLCRDDPEHAATLMQAPGLSGGEIRFIVAKYARDYQRIMIDLRHEFQQKMLLLSQRFDLEALNFSEEKIINSAVHIGPSTLFDISGNTGNVSLNFGSISSANASTIARDIGYTINSGIVYNENDEKILDIIKNNEDRVVGIQLRSDLDQAKTSSLPETERKISRGRLSSFLYAAASKAADELAKRSINELITYVMKNLL